MQINKEFLKSLKPCADRYENYLEHHASFDGSFSEFIDLPYLDYNDKVWVAVRVLTSNQAVKWSVLCAESVVHIFEDKHPDDKSLSTCINFLKTVNDFNNLTETEKLEIEKRLDIIQVNYAACAVDAVFAAIYAAFHATSAAFHAANAAKYAVFAAIYAAKNAGEDADSAGNNQKELNLQFLKQVTSYS